MSLAEKNDIQLTVILPAYNEEQAIGETVLKIHELGLKDCEVLVVDDGSSDSTARVALAAGARVVSHPYNIGNGAAVKTGIRSARGCVLVFLDGDGQHDPRDIPRLLAHIPRTTWWSERARARAIRPGTETRRTSFTTVSPLSSPISASRILQRLPRDARQRRTPLLRHVSQYLFLPTTSTLAFLRSGRAVKYVPIRVSRRKGRSKIKLLRDGSAFLLIILKIAMSFSPLRVFLRSACCCSCSASRATCTPI
jgi:glycosyltransferase involved in cell wall biosynthesis